MDVQVLDSLRIMQFAMQQRQVVLSVEMEQFQALRPVTIQIDLILTDVQQIVCLRLMQYAMLQRPVVPSVETQSMKQELGILKDVTMETETMMMDVQVIALLKRIHFVQTLLELKVYADDVDMWHYNPQKFVTMETTPMETVVKLIVLQLKQTGDVIFLSIQINATDAETVLESSLKFVMMAI